MATWLVPKKAAAYIKQNSPESMVGERTLRNLIKQGFPCIKIDSRTLINIETFDEDIRQFALRNSIQNSKENTVVNNGIRKNNI